MSTRSMWSGLLLVVAGCGDDGGGDDAGPGPIDSGGMDSGEDGGAIDAGEFPCVRWQPVEYGGESDDGSVRLALVRQFCVEAPPGWAFAGGCPVAATRFELAFGGSTYLADRAEQFAYE